VNIYTFANNYNENMSQPSKNYLEDKDLIDAFKIPESKERAFTDIVKKYQERIYWHIRRLVVHHEDANDVMQNVFIKMWSYLDNFREESNLYTWIYRIATNETITFIDKEKKRKSISLSDDDTGLANRLHAEKGFDPNKLEWKLQRAIQALPEKQRIVFTLRYYDEMPYEQMSEVLETSAGALKASYHHAVKKVEEYLKSDLNFGEIQ
jgi:RNA polymerase sigma factor (sigma-70 family)